MKIPPFVEAKPMATTAVPIPMPSADTLNIFFYTVGSYAALQAFREWSLASKRFYLEHLHIPPKTKVQFFHYHRMKLICCIGAMIGCAFQSAFQVIPPVTCTLGLEFAIGEVFRQWIPGYKERWNWFHLHTILAGAVTGWLFWRGIVGRNGMSRHHRQLLSEGNRKQLAFNHSNRGIYYGTLVGTTLCLGRLYRE